MEGELDKRLNCKCDFKYLTINAKEQARLLRLSCNAFQQYEQFYNLEIVHLVDLPYTPYKALSYTWGHAQSMSDVQEIHIDGQPFWIRQNLFDFLNTAAARDECGLFFIDAICINQLDHGERQSQVQEMARIYRNADEVIAWLGIPDTGQLGNVRALCQRGDNSQRGCANWNISQWEGFRYLTYHPFWSRIWIVQEVLLASSMVIWCGSFIFPLSLLGGAVGTIPAAELKFAANGRPSTVVNASLRLRSPAAKVISHRLRHVPRLLTDHMAQGTKIGTMEEMMTYLRHPFEVMETYQSQVPDLLHQAVRKFGNLECSDPRDRLYGLLGILNERSRAKIEVDYRRDVSYAYYQALKIGLQELYGERGLIYLHSNGAKDHSYLGYYCDLRDRFGINDGHSLSILRRVLGELDFPARLQDVISGAQWPQQFNWSDTEFKIYPDFKQILTYAEIESPKAEGLLFKFHTRQRHLIQILQARFSPA